MRCAWAPVVVALSFSLSSESDVKTAAMCENGNGNRNESESEGNNNGRCQHRSWLPREVPLQMLCRMMVGEVVQGGAVTEHVVVDG